MLSSALHEAAVHRGLSGLPALARAAAETLPDTDPRRGEAWLGAGEEARAGAAFASAGRAAFEAGRFGAAARAWDRALALAPDQLPLADRLALAGALGVLGRYSGALAALATAAPEAPLDWAAVAERQAWLLGRQGELAAARGVLETGIAALGASSPEEVAARRGLQARLARTFVSLGALDLALAQAQEPLQGTGPAARPRPAQAAALALAYRGQVAEAEALLAEPAAADPAFEARASFLRGFCQQLAGRPDLASAAYQAAVDAHAALDDRHGVASATFNLGACWPSAAATRSRWPRSIRPSAIWGAWAPPPTWPTPSSPPGCCWCSWAKFRRRRAHRPAHARGGAGPRFAAVRGLRRLPGG